MNWFGRNKKSSSKESHVNHGSLVVTNAKPSQGSNASNAVLALRDSIATQEKREQHLDKKIEELTADAKAKMTKKDKKGALASLRCKKLYEAEVDKIANVKMTLEVQVIKITSAASDADTVKAMEEAKNVMKAIREDTSIEKVDDIMDAIREEFEQADEISNALAQPIDPLLAYDDDELLAELHAMEETKGVENQLLDQPIIAMPDAPNDGLPVIQNVSVTMEEEEELKRLEEEIGG